MTIARSTVRAGFFSEVYSVLNTNVSDPRSRGKQWIFSVVPDILAPNFIGYPIIIINKAKIKKEFDVFDNSYSDLQTPIVITVYDTDQKRVEILADSVDGVMIVSNFPQFKFTDYAESDGDTDFGRGKVYFTTMSHSVELEGL